MDVFQKRQYNILVVFVLATLLLIFKALQIQVLDETYQHKADAVAVDLQTIYPSRGLIYDRNKKLLVNNNPMYDLLVIYNQTDPNMDTTKLCHILDIDKVTFKKQLNKNWRSPRFSKSVPFIFMSKLSAQTYAQLQECLYEFPGFKVQLRNVRGYTHRSAAHLLGYLREVNRSDIEKNPDLYTPGDYIGASGLEYAYEKHLRGQKGVANVLKDNLGRDVGAFQEGSKDVPAISGQDLVTTLDIDLQQYAELLMQNKRGSVVAINPNDGGILTMLSAPSYDPSLLTINRERGKAYAALQSDENQPLFNRALMAEYPPGSLFKPLVALIAMQEGTLTSDRGISCKSGYYIDGKKLMGCHAHPYASNLETAIQHSCNAYFATVFRDVVDSYGTSIPSKGLDRFNTYLDSMGLGRPLGIDLDNEKGGNYPTSEYYTEKVFKGDWKSVWIRSVGIGQGELLATNLQLANAAAFIANRGHYYTPNLVSRVIVHPEDNETTIQEIPSQKQVVHINQEYFPPVINGMEGAVRAGTARQAYIPDIPICGKTGTAENPHGEDHSIFFAFAPKENPQIAVAVYVENGGWGGSYAAPIASLMIEKYIKGEIRSANRKYLEKRMLTADLMGKELP